VLAPGGRLLLVQSEFTGIERSCEMLREEGYDDVEVVARRKHPFGPVLTRRAVHLERAGLLTPGRRREELAVLRARA
jgi:release factor glutamine methyltransferase